MNITAGEMIRQARKKAKLTQKQLSEKYKIPLSTLKDWEGGQHKCQPYVANLLLRCMTIDFPIIAETALSEQEQSTKPAEPTYIFCDQYTKRPLSAELAKIAREEFEAGKVQLLKEYEQDFYGDLVESKRRRKGKIYRCTNSDYDPDREIPMGFEFLVIIEEV